MANNSLLIIIGEIIEEEQKETLAKHIVDGLKSWGHTEECDLNSELLNVANSAPQVARDESGGEYLVHNSDTLSTHVLLRPTLSGLYAAVDAMIGGEPTGVRMLVYAGMVVESTGHWMVADALFSPEMLIGRVKRSNVAKDKGDGTGPCWNLHVASPAVEGEWRSLPSKLQALLPSNARISVNGGAKMEDLTGLVQLASVLVQQVAVESLEYRIPTSSVVGAVKFPKPSLYIFPEGGSDACLLGVTGFVFLVNGGSTKKPNFWNFVRHLDRVDGFFMSNWSPENLLGSSSYLSRVVSGGTALGACLLPPGPHRQKGHLSVPHRGDLVVNVVREANSMHHMLSQLDIPTVEMMLCKPQAHPRPLVLYRKVGYGTLELFPLSPVENDSELTRILEEWSKAPAHLPDGSLGKGHPLPALNHLSVNALLVWRPESPQESITRILLTGMCHQARVIQGTDTMVGQWDYLRTPVAVPADMEKAAKAQASHAGKPNSAGPHKSAAPSAGSKHPAGGAKSGGPPSATARPASGKGAAAHAPVPAKSHAPAPAKSNAPAPSKSHAPAAAKSHAPAAAKSHESAPTKSHAPAAAKSHTPAPAKSHAPAPAKSHAPAPTKLHAPAAAKSHSPAVAKSHENAPTKSHAPAPAKSHEPAPAKSHAPALAKSHTPPPAKKEPEKPSANGHSEKKTKKHDAHKEDNKTEEAVSKKTTVASHELDTTDGVKKEVYSVKSETVTEKTSVQGHTSVVSTKITTSGDDHVEVNTTEYVMQSTEQVIGDPTKMELDGLVHTDGDFGVQPLTPEEQKGVPESLPDPDQTCLLPSQTVPQPPRHLDMPDEEMDLDPALSMPTPDGFQGTLSSRDILDLDLPDRPSSGTVESAIPELGEADYHPESPQQLTAEQLRAMGIYDEDEDDDEEEEEQKRGDSVDSLVELATVPAHESSGQGVDLTKLSMTASFYGKDDEAESNGVTKTDQVDTSEFDPVGSWGKPLGLPQPADVDAAAAKKKPIAGKAQNSSATAAKKPEARPSSARPASASSTAAGRPSTAPKKRTDEAKGSRASSETRNHSGSKKPAPTRTTSAKLPNKDALPGATMASAHATGANRAPYDRLRACYVDLAYIPAHGDPRFVDVEFFKRVRARHYVLSAVDPNTSVLDSLLIGKESWGPESDTLEATIIPTYENEALLHWLTTNKDRLDKAKIDMAPAASRCTVELQGHEGVCTAYRIEF